MRHRFDDEEQIAASHALVALADPHIKSSNGLIVQIDIDHLNHPGQDMNQPFVEGHPQSAAIVESIATAVDSRFPKMVQYLIEDKSEMMTTTGEMLKRGNNVIVATNHSDLIDIAVAQAAVFCALEHFGFKFKSSIVISKMISILGYKIEGNVAPAVETLELMCNQIFLSFPRTESVKKSRLQRVLGRLRIDNYNSRVVKSITERLDEGGMLLAVAPSGTTDKKGIMAAISRGTSAILAHKKSFVMPLAVSLEKDNLIFESAGGLRALESEDEAHDMMDGIANQLSRVGSEVRYSRHHHASQVGKTALSLDTTT